VIRFTSLGSGSEGNALLIEAGGTRLLIDCGLPVRQAFARIEARGVDPMGLDAILVTHEHGDHIGGVMAFARKTGTTVCLTRGTYAALHSRSAEACNGVTLRIIDSHVSFELGSVEIQPFPVPHDAREPVQYVIVHGPLRLGVLTDLGMLTPHVERSLQNCDGLMLEFNHDPDLLAASSYPDSLKQRIAGRYGHLCNRDAAGLLGRLDLDRLQHIVAAHLSKSNNTTEHVVAAVREVLAEIPAHFYVATQEDGFDWLELVPLSA
jgi:phosphoribosyl 1,2-cyclic phosphodiesterase